MSLREKFKKLYILKSFDKKTFKKQSKEKLIAARKAIKNLYNIAK